MLVPYSKYRVVDWPFGLTLPLSLAVVAPIELAEFVVAAGAFPVENVWSEPWLEPPSLVATMRKW